MEHNNPDAVPAGSAQNLSLVALSSQNLMYSDVITVNLADRDPRGMDFQSLPLDYMQIRLPDSRQPLGLRPAPRLQRPYSTHTDMTEARPTQPTISAKPDTLTLHVE